MANINEKSLFGLRIKNYRLSNGYTQDEFCSKIGIDVTTLSKIETGKNFPSFETLSSLIRILKVEPNEFLDFARHENTEEELLNLMILEQIRLLPKETKQKFYELIKVLK